VGRSASSRPHAQIIADSGVHSVRPTFALSGGAHDTTGAGRVERLVRSVIPGSSRAPRRRPSADAMVRQVGGPGDGNRRVPVLRLLCFVMVAAARPFSGPQGSPRPARSRWPRAPTPLRLVVRDFRIFRVFQFSEHPIGGRRDFPSGMRNTSSPAGAPGSEGRGGRDERNPFRDRHFAVKGVHGEQPAMDPAGGKPCGKPNPRCSNSASSS